MRLSLTSLLLAAIFLPATALMTVSFGATGFAISLVHVAIVIVAASIARAGRHTLAHTLMISYLLLWLLTAVTGTVETRNRVHPLETHAGPQISSTTRRLSSPAPPWTSYTTLSPCPLVTITETGWKNTEPDFDSDEPHVYGNGKLIVHFSFFNWVYTIDESTVWRIERLPWLDDYFPSPYPPHMAPDPA